MTDAKKLTPAQAAHVQRVQVHFAQVCRNLPMPRTRSPRDLFILQAASWLAAQVLLNPSITKDAAVAKFQTEFAEKYAAGADEHGGNLWQKPGMLDKLAEEIVDAACYADTAAEQVDGVARGRAA